MHPLIDPDIQKKAVLYHKAHFRLNLIEIFVSSAYFALFYYSGLSSEVSTLAAHFWRPAAVALYLLGFLPLVLILFPLNFLKDYALERKFGLSSQSFRSWLMDRLKGAVLGILFGYPLLLLLFYLFNRFHGFWWVFAVCVMFLVQLFTAFIFPVLLLPLFFKQEPIKDPLLIKEAAVLLTRAGVKYSGIYSFNMSTKTKRENAALAGLWSTRRILLADTLLEKKSLDEVLAVLAHEVGHHLKKHMLKLAALGFATSSLLFFSIHRVMSLFPGFPEDFPQTLSLLPIMVIAAGVLSFPLSVLANFYSRMKEREADAVSLALTGNSGAFIRLMAGIANTNLAVAYPGKIRKLLFYSHPPIGDRIAFAERWKATKP